MGMERGLRSLETVKSFVRAVLIEDATYVTMLFIECYICRREMTSSHSEISFS
jgi:hypothetical protein